MDSHKNSKLRVKFVLNREAPLGIILILPAIIVIAFTVLYPLIYSLGLSFFSKDLLNPDKGTTWVGLGNYISVLQSSSFIKALVNSIILTSTSVIIQLIIGLGLALLLQAPFRGRSVIRGIFILPWAVPTFVAAFAWMWMLDFNYGAVNQFLTAIGLIQQGIAWLGTVKTAMLMVILANIWKGLPWVFLVLSAGLQMVPKELQEAARVDGASFWQELRNVIIPSMSKVIAITVILRTIWTFNWFDFVYLLTGGGPSNATLILPIEVYNRAFLSYRFGLASAVGTFMFIILLLFLVVYFKVDREMEV